MRPIRVSSRGLIPKSPAEIAAEIADLDNWTDFKGYGILPGVAGAEYGLKTDEMVGSRIHVRNTDGSTHIEEILVWDPPERLLLKLREFSRPLSRLADYFTEEWLFELRGDTTQVTRRFEMFPRRALTRPMLWVISRFFRRAIDRHLAQL